MPKEPIKKNTTTVIKQSVEIVQSEEQKPYSNMLQGKATNALAKTSKRGASVDAITGVGEIMTTDTVKVFIQNFNNVALNVNTHKVLDALTLELTSNFPHGKEATAESIDKHRAVTLSVDDYMNLCGLKDKKEARKQLKEAMQTLYNLSLEWSEVHYHVPDGKKKRIKEEIHAQARIIDYMGHDLEQNPVKRGGVYAKFTMDIAKYLSKAYIMPYPDKLLTINSNASRHSYYIGRKLAEHHNMNIGKPNANRISVKALIDALPDLPSYDEVINTDAKQVTKRIIQPFERSLIAIKDTYGILCEWHYCNSKGEPLTEEQVESYSYSTWEQWLIEYELADYPDQSERLAKTAERIKIATKRKNLSKGKTDRQIAAGLRVSNSTVSEARKEMVANGDVCDSHTSTDTLGREQPRQTMPGLSEAEKIKMAWQLNDARRQLAPDEKRMEAERRLRESPEVSDRQIAKQIGASNAFVSRVRNDMAGRGEVCTVHTSLGADGKEYPREIQRNGKTDTKSKS